MTLARDPLVVVAALRKVLNGVQWSGEYQSCPECENVPSQGHATKCSIGSALALSAPMPAPERPSVEECPYRVDQQVDCYCVVGPTLHTYGPWPLDAVGAGRALELADTLNAAYQAGRRAIGGGE